MARPARFAAALTLTVAFACGPVGAPPAPESPINSGCPENCAGYAPAVGSAVVPQCSVYGAGSVCVVNQELSFVLVISVPLTAAASPGATFVVKPDATQTVAGVIKLPNFGTIGGAYLTTNGVAMKVGRNTYTSSNGAFYTTLPVHVAYYPLWTEGSALVDAASVGLPLLPIEAAVVTPPNWPQSDTFAAISLGVGGTKPASATGWSIAVPDPASGEQYTSVVTVDPPFDDAFPPKVTVGQPETSFVDQTLLNAIPDGTLTGVALGQPGTLDGWQVYIQEVATGRRMSNKVTLHGAITEAAPPLSQLFTADPEPASGWAIVVVPADPTLPISTNNILASVNGSAAPFQVTYPVRAPLLGSVKPVKLAGTVRAAGGAAAAASIVFQSVTIDVAGVPPGTSNALSFATTATAGSNGAYAVTLPPGSYDVTVTPVSPSLAKVTSKMTITGGTLDLPLPLQPIFSGTCVVADRRPLAIADVELTASIGLAAGPAAQRPRPRLATTDDQGRFSVALDAGFYDITVKPAAGSRLPWIVVPNYPVSPQGGVALGSDTCVIPAPVLESLTIENIASAPVPSTLVRAYSVNTTDGIWHEIGNGFTDESGHTDMFLTSLQLVP